MKPFSSERLHAAVERARAEIDRSSSRQLKATLHALLEDIQRERAYPEWLLIKKDERSVFLRVADIDWIESSRNNVRLHVGKEVYVFHETTSGIESQARSEAGSSASTGRRSSTSRGSRKCTRGSTATTR